MTKFNPQCTLPTGPSTFVSGPNVRGTLDIIWGCLSIILICTWSVLHLNVPVQTRPRNKKEEYVRAAVRLRQKVFWMLVNVIAPDWAFASALGQYRAVSFLQPAFDTFSRADAVPWTRKHTYFANLGGFTVRFSETVHVGEDGPGTTPASNHELAATQFAQNSQPSPGDADPTDRPGDLQSSAKHMISATVETTAGCSVDSTAEGKLESGTLVKGSTSEDDAIPSEIAELLERLESTPLKGPDRWRESRLPIGQLRSAPNDRNFAVASDTVRGLKLSDFANESERSHFLRDAEAWWRNIKALERDRWVLNADQLLLAREMGLIQRLPNIVDDDLNERNKGDAIVKIVAIFQILWFVLQFVVRLAAEQSTSQLEVMTFAFAVCQILTYCLLLEKPKGVQWSIEIPADRYPDCIMMARLALVGPNPMDHRKSLSLPNSDYGLRVARRNKNEEYLDVLNPFLGFGVVSLVFGAVHCIAWNFVFPNHYENLLWRISSVYTAVAWPLMVMQGASLLLLDKLDRNIKNYFSPPKAGCSTTHRKPQDSWLGILAMSMVAIECLIFVAARFFVLVESIRSLAFLDPKIFLTTTWPTALPHFS